MSMEIENPRRVMLIGWPDSGALGLLKDLTGSAPEPRPLPSATSSTQVSEEDTSQPLSTTAGLSHTLTLKTRYYSADLPVWLDEISDVAAWKSDFVEPDAAEVVKSLGAWIIAFHARDVLDNVRREEVKSLMAAIKAAVTVAHGGEDIWDGVCLTVGLDGGKVGTSSDVTGWEDALTQFDDDCLDYGFEFVDARGGQHSSSNDREKRGVERVREALEVNDWAADGDIDVDDFEGFGADEDMEQMKTGLLAEDSGFEVETAQFNKEFADLKMELLDEGASLPDRDGPDENDQVEQLERMMVRIQAARDMSAHMPEAERKRFAARTVNELMKDM